MREIAGSKARDYAHGSRWSNFDATSEFSGFEHNWLSACFMVVQKASRLRSLRAQGRLDMPNHESVYDTLLDMANYATLALAMYIDSED